jgi:hypothetical protein
MTVEPLGRIGRHRTRWSLAAILCLVVAGSGLACSGKSTDKTPQENALVSERQLGRGTTDSPSRTTLELWRAIQVGDLPSAAAFYSDEVRAAIGIGNILGALAQQRASITVLRPRILSVVRTPRGIEVTLRAMSGGSSVGLQSFLLQRGRSGWRVVYDTLMGDALPSYVQSSVQHRVAPNSTTTAPAALVAADRIVDKYRTLTFRFPEKRKQSKSR